MDAFDYAGPPFKDRPLNQFGRCGWNLKHVSEHLFSTYNRAGVRICPPEDARFDPRPSRPRALKSRPPRIEFLADIDLSPNRDPVPSAAQQAAFHYLVEHEADLLGAILDAVGARIVQLGLDHARGELGEDFSKLEALLHNREGVGSLIQFVAVTFADGAKGKTPAIGFQGNDALDEEHGFGVVTRGLQILQVGGSVVGWSNLDRA